jgi:Cytochrome c554 and c-prime
MPLSRDRVIAFVVLGLFILGRGLITFGQPGPVRPARNANPMDIAPSPYISTPKDCEKCHSHPEDWKQEDVICRMNESLTWWREDRHRKAFESFNILNSRAQEIGTRLGIDVTTHRACLACHSIIDWPTGDPNVSGAKDPIPMPGFDRGSNGVSCVACHGAFKEWVLEHPLYRDPSWRKHSRQDKERLKGMLDLWNPVTRAAKCFSCHVGKADEDKVLTHAAYAAGHPRLPGIEVFTYSQATPRHWEYLDEKLKRLGNTKPEVQAAIMRTFDLGRLEHTELVAISAIVLFRETLTLLVAQMDVTGKANSSWPELSSFDCSACHHDLKAPGWRQARAVSGTHGRPTLPYWPTALVRIGVVAADPKKAPLRLKEFESKLRDLQTAITSKPFGDSVMTLAAANALIAWANPIVRDLSQVRIDRPLALELLDRTFESAQSRKPDFDTARQLYWAYRAIYEELEPKVDPQAPVSALVSAIDAEFSFGLRSAGLQQPIEKTIASRLQASADYDADEFMARFLKLPNQAHLK